MKKIAYLVILSTSASSIITICHRVQKKEIQMKDYFMYFIFQFFFVLDSIGTILLIQEEKKIKEEVSQL